MMELFKALFVKTLTRPLEAAGDVLSLALSRQALWMLLVLAAVLNALIFSLGFHAQPPQPVEGLSPEEVAQVEFLLAFFGSPMRVAMMVAGGLFMSVFAFFWAGRFVGGQGTLEDILAVVTWWQFVGIALSVVILVVGLVALPLASFLSLVGNLWLLYALVGLITGAHRFDTALKGLGTLALAIVLMVFGLMILLVILGLFVPAGA